MKKTAIICEYNPFHNGHKYQLDTIKSILPDSKLISIMSPSFVQRGQPAVFDKYVRGECAVKGGADLVVSMPQVFALLSAEGFAECGVKIAKAMAADTLAFGVEDDSIEKLTNIAEALLSDDFERILKEELDTSPEASFPSIRQLALSRLVGDDATLISTPNNILAVEYIKAKIKHFPEMKLLPIKRIGNAHDSLSVSGQYLSATSIRELIHSGKTWLDKLPSETVSTVEHVNRLNSDRYQDFLYAVITLSNYERIAMASGSKELADTIYSAIKKCGCYDEFRASIARKKFTQTKIDRAVSNIILGIKSDEFIHCSPEYVTLLAGNGEGRRLVASLRGDGIKVISRYAEYKKIKSRQADIEALADRIWSRCAQNPSGEKYFIDKKPYVTED